MSAALEYPLARTTAEHRRLAVQAQFWAPEAEALFASVGLAEAMTVADLGCGTLHVAKALARRVGRAGRVYALDNDAALLEQSASESETAGVTLLQADAYDTPWDDAMLDAVHARFVAAPCGRCDALIAEMLRVLRPGGVLMLQEPVSDTWQIDGAGAAWPRVHALIREGFRLRGGDFDAGGSLVQRLAPHLTDLQAREVAYTMPAAHPYASLPLDFCASLAALWHRERLVGEGELGDLRRHLADALAQARARVRTFTLVQVWGRKRGRR